MLRFGSNNGNIRPFNKVWWCSCFFEKLAFDIKYSTASSFSYSFKISFAPIYWYGPSFSYNTKTTHTIKTKANFLYQKCLTIKSALEVDYSFKNLFISLADFPKNHNLRLHFHIFKKVLFLFGFSNRMGHEFSIFWILALKCYIKQVLNSVQKIMIIQQNIYKKTFANKIYD